MKAAFSAGYQIMQLPITIEGFTFNMWQMFLFFAVMYFVIHFVFRFFD